MHAVHRIDDVGARLAKDDEENGGFAIHQSGGADILDGVVHLGDIAQDDRGAIVIAHDQRLVIFGFEKLIVVGDVLGYSVVGDLPFGAVGILHGQNAAERLQA